MHAIFWIVYYKLNYPQNKSDNDFKAKIYGCNKIMLGNKEATHILTFKL